MGPHFLSQAFRIEDIPPQGLEGTLEANASEREAIAGALDLLDLDRLTFAYTLRRSGKSNFKLEGKLEAAVTQSCVVTLDPVRSEISEDVSLQFWPPRDIERLELDAGDGESEIDLEGPEPIEDGMIDIGQIAYETLASSLDPYPRKEGVEFEWEAGEDEDALEHPFSVLRSLKSKGNS